MNVIIGLICLAIFLRYFGNILKCGDAFVKAFREAHEEIKREGTYAIQFYDPQAPTKKK